MTKEIPNMAGRNRPKLTSDALGYNISVGDKEWPKIKKLYKQLSNGNWVRL